MKITKNISKKNIILTAAVALASVLARVFCHISIFNMLMFPVLYFIVQNVQIECSEKYGWLCSAAAIGAGSVLTTWLMQYLLLVEDLRDKISNDKFILNVLCCLIVYLTVHLFTRRAGLTCIVSHTLLMLFAGVNYFVYAFRGNELTFGDLRSAFTGLSVASNYRFSLNAQAMNAVLLSAVLIAAAAKLKLESKRKWSMRLICLLLAALSFLYVTGETEDTVTESWEQKGSYRNGYLLNFALSIRDSFVEKPKLYSAEAIAALEDTYRTAQSPGSGKKPAIIAIMNESFADLSVLGNLETNEPVLPFVGSLSENTVKGYALSSVFGAKTPNSEWEFLTGGSMAFLPSGSVPYQQYIKKDNAWSIVDTLHKEDYTCVAMHPYYATGWSRDAVYPRFGFDEMYFLESFDQSSLMRKYVSDKTMYDKIIERYEAGKGHENLFLMGITMQNHGGYTELYDNFNHDIYGTNVRYPDANQYLSLAHQSDLAIRDLIQYFKDCGEPVVICFFGDHQPSLNSAFYRRLNGKGMSGLSIDELEEFFTVPFFIWTNYESESRTVEQTSLNFLSTMLLEQAGIPLPSYHRFLAELMETVPAMNARAFYSKNAGRYIHYGKGNAEEESWLEKYRILQYNGLFDKRNRSGLFFGR